MSSTEYARLSLDDLFTELQTTVIRKHEVFVSGEPIDRQHMWADKHAEIHDEIQARGDEAQQRYVPLLTAAHPSVRLAAALAIRKIAPDLALPVLVDLSDGKYGGTIAVNAGMTLDAMRQRGEIP